MPEPPVHQAPADPVGEAVAAVLAEVLGAASVEVRYRRHGTDGDVPDAGVATAVAWGPGPPGWEMGVVARLDHGVARLVRPGVRSALVELLETLPSAGLWVAGRLRHQDDPSTPVTPALERAMRDMVATEIISRYLAKRVGRPVEPALAAETIEYLIELSGTRVEAHDLTHGVVVADVLDDTPRLEFRYPRHVRPAKRAPLLFDGMRSVLLVDPEGRARTELQRHRLQRFSRHGRPHPGAGGPLESGSLVADASRALGGVGFFLRPDRSIWTFADGEPLLIRRGEHWTAFPIELSSSIADMVGGDVAAGLVAQAAFDISAQPRGAILAIVRDASALEAVVPLKDRYDLRNEIDPTAMRPETRLHHLIDSGELDELTLVRLATLDGATVLDLEGRLLAYGAIVTTVDSEHEGARTAAARTLSETAEVVLKVSVDGDITIFRHGAAVTTLLGRPAGHRE